MAEREGFEPAVRHRSLISRTNGRRVRSKARQDGSRSTDRTSSPPNVSAKREYSRPGWRLSAIGASRSGNWVSGDEDECTKSRYLRPYLAFPGKPSQKPQCLAGAGGFEPPYGGIKIRRFGRHILFTLQSNRTPHASGVPLFAFVPICSLYQRTLQSKEVTGDPGLRGRAARR